ncbi:RimK family alpha-L-glutamate ligase [Hyphomonas sp.]|uniref:ATP-grasp domain-containing protein n=1 Tax=Hyphomonas sp. TaxID=87 RepID=UPI003527DEAA
MKIAYIASQVTLPSSPNRREDAFEHDLMMDSLRPAFAARGMTIEDIAWDNSDADWSSYGAAIVGTTWDYWDRQDEFLSALARIESKTRLYNPVSLIRWNIHKSYLRELEAKGARIIPTVWLDKADAKNIAAAFAMLQAEDLVFKRQVGAGAEGQHRLKPGDAVPDMPHPMMVQPFLPSIQSEGEYSFIFIGGDFCHALVKRAVPGDYRIQSKYGGKETPVDPPAEDLNDASAIIAMLDEAPLYARVDMVRGEDGHLVLMELEAIEPYLYPVEGPRLGDMIAEAVKKRLETAPV